MKKSFLLLAPLLILLNAYSVAAVRRDSAPSTCFFGVLIAASDLLWLKAAQRVAFIDRVSPREAEAHDRLIRVAVRLNPEAREPYRYGAIGLVGWNRPDLALRLAREGASRHLDDDEMQRTLAMVLVLAGESLDQEAYRQALEAGMIESPGQRRIIGILRAVKEEEWGETERAIEAWRWIEEMAEDDPALWARAHRAIERLGGTAERNGV